MVVLVPAWLLGFLFVFLVGACVTYVILQLIAKKGENGNPTYYRDSGKRVVPRLPAEGKIQENSLVGGGVAVLLVAALLITLAIAGRKEWTTSIWYGLIVIGILFGLSTFVLFGSKSSSKARTKYRPTNTRTRQEPQRRRQKRQADHRARVNEAQRRQQESERERQNHQAEYQARVCEIRGKQAEIEAIKDDLYALFGMLDDQSRKRGRLLAEVLNRLFEASDILVIEAFEPVEREGEGVSESIDGVIELDGCLYLVEMKWWKEPLGTQEVSPCLVRIFNRGYPGGVLLSYSEFTQPAIATCKQALSQITVVLCELEEIVTLLEQNASLRDLLKAKITAAVADKNPLFRS